MLDKKSIAVLKILNKQAEGNAYKVITSDEIISLVAQKSQYDADSIKEIMTFLSEQDYLNIKFSEENTYCYSLLPKARIFLEQQTKSKAKKNAPQIMMYVYTMIASFIGSILALLVFFYLTI